LIRAHQSTSFESFVRSNSSRPYRFLLTSRFSATSETNEAIVTLLIQTIRF